MKKVMFMVNSLNGGGAEKVLQTLLSHLDYSKYDVTLYSMHRENIAEMDYPDWIHYKVVFDHYDAKNAVSLQIQNLAERIKGKLFTILPSKLFYSIFFHENSMLKSLLSRARAQKLFPVQPISVQRNMLGCI